MFFNIDFGWVMGPQNIIFLASFETYLLARPSVAMAVLTQNAQ